VSARPIPIVYSARYRIDIGPHVFPTRKYSMVRARLLETRLAGLAFVEPEPAGWDELALVHTAEYLARMRDGALTSDGSRSCSCRGRSRWWRDFA
jgi:acetoin utilization deacetylase AcuC-like enzyme